MSRPESWLKLQSGLRQFAASTDIFDSVTHSHIHTLAHIHRAKPHSRKHSEQEEPDIAQLVLRPPHRTKRPTSMSVPLPSWVAGGEEDSFNVSSQSIAVSSLLHTYLPISFPPPSPSSSSPSPPPCPPTSSSFICVHHPSLHPQVAAQSLREVADEFLEEGNPIVTVAKKMSQQMFQMAEFTHGRGELQVGV